MRNSRQKQIIKNIVMNRDDHPSAATICEEVRRIDGNISLATVYRNLNQMVANGELRKVSIPNAADRFCCNMAPHSHFYCTQCHLVMDIKNIQPLLGLRPIESKYNINIQEIQSLCIGLCDKCNKTNIEREINKKEKV